jgi:hypothetical protein
MQQLQETNTDYCVETINLYRVSMVNIAERLWHIRNDEKWSGRWDSWEDYLGEMGMKKGTASKLCSLYERMIIELKFPTETLHAAPWTNLYTALPMMKDRESAEKAITSASVLTNREIYQERYYQQYGKECECLNAYPMRHCPDCKRYFRVYEN